MAREGHIYEQHRRRGAMKIRHVATNSCLTVSNLSIMAIPIHPSKELGAITSTLMEG